MSKSRPILETIHYKLQLPKLVKVEFPEIFEAQTEHYMFMKGEFIMAVAELQHIPQSSLHCLCMCVLVWVWRPRLTLHSPAHLPSISSLTCNISTSILHPVVVSATSFLPACQPASSPLLHTGQPRTRSPHYLSPSPNPATPEVNPTLLTPPCLAFGSQTS